MSETSTVVMTLNDSPSDEVHDQIADFTHAFVDDVEAHRLFVKPRDVRMN